MQDIELRSVVNMLSAELALMRAAVLLLLDDAAPAARAVAVQMMQSYATTWAPPMPLYPEAEAMQARAVLALADGYREILAADPATRAVLQKLGANDALKSQRDHLRDRLKVVPSADQNEG